MINAILYKQKKNHRNIRFQCLGGLKKQDIGSIIKFTYESEFGYKSFVDFYKTNGKLLVEFSIWTIYGLKTNWNSNVFIKYNFLEEFRIKISKVLLT